MGKYSVWDKKGVPESNLGKWRSIEFEVIFNSITTLNDFVAFVNAKDYSDFITIKTDGSLIPNRKKGGIPKEVCVSFTRNDDKIVRDICGAFKDKAYVNKTCGTHVHFDMRGVKKEMVAEYGNRLGRCVPILKKLVPESRRDNNYCYGTVNSMNGDYDRYTFVNMMAYKAHKTIEVRGHSGTLNANKILNWIKVCEKIMMRKPSEKTKTISSLEELVGHYKFNEEVAQFINKRFDKLNNVKEHEVPSAT
jgi:Putative amidoligase enzyme